MTDLQPASQTTLAVTGKPVACALKEIATHASQLGYQLVRPDTDAFSILVVACDPQAADISRARLLGARIMTERQFLDDLAAPDLLRGAMDEASDPTTSKSRLTQLAAIVPEAVAQNPLWQILHLEDPDFLTREDPVMKLRLLKHAPAGRLEDLADMLTDELISVDVFEIHGASYEEADPEQLRHSVDLDGFEVTLSCHDCDAEMEDVGDGCDERLSIGDCIKAYIFKPFEDLQSIAEQCGLEYEEAMSPCDGYPFRVGEIEIDNGEELLGYEWSSFPDDQDLIARLVDTGDGIHRGLSVKEVGARRPLFGAPPVADEETSDEGAITVRWSCDCFLPVRDSGDSETSWRKVQINEEADFYGSSVHDDYTIEYAFSLPIELERRLAKDMDDSAQAAAAVNACVLAILGLRAEDCLN